MNYEIKKKILVFRIKSERGCTVCHVCHNVPQNIIMMNSHINDYIKLCQLRESNRSKMEDGEIFLVNKFRFLAYVLLLLLLGDVAGDGHTCLCVDMAGQARRGDRTN